MNGYNFNPCYLATRGREKVQHFLSQTRHRTYKWSFLPLNLYPTLITCVFVFINLYILDNTNIKTLQCFYYPLKRTIHIHSLHLTTPSNTYFETKHSNVVFLPSIVSYSSSCTYTIK